jgi:cytochrome b
MCDMQNSYGQESEKYHLIWDLPVRIVHWILVLGMACAYVTQSLGFEYYVYHLASGYLVIVAVVFRIVWGFLGTHHARFKHFIPRPMQAWSYLKDVLRSKEDRYVGHNPLGALMAAALLAGLLIQAISGLFVTDDIFNYGPLYLLVSEPVSEVLAMVHRNLFYIIFYFVLAHVAAVAYHRVVKRENLIGAMITGRKRLGFDEAEFAIASSRVILASVILVAVFASLAGLLSMLSDVY